MKVVKFTALWHKSTKSKPLFKSLLFYLVLHFYFSVIFQKKFWFATKHGFYIKCDTCYLHIIFLHIYIILGSHTHSPQAGSGPTLTHILHQTNHMLRSRGCGIHGPNTVHTLALCHFMWLTGPNEFDPAWFILHSLIVQWFKFFIFILRKTTFRNQNTFCM